MTADKEGIYLEHDTTMCGDPKVWFPMRVTYSHELKVKTELDRLKRNSLLVLYYNSNVFIGENTTSLGEGCNSLWL